MDEGLATGVLTVVLSFATAASGQPQGPQFHDCWTSTRSPSFAIGATADGQALRFDRSPDGFYPWPARRMRETGDVLVQCSAVSDRPIHCFVVDEPCRRFKLGATALEVMSLARLTDPAGVWPLDIDVRFRQSDPGDPTLIPCVTRAPTRSARPATSD
jgi:hypothetical protein